MNLPPDLDLRAFRRELRLSQSHLARLLGVPTSTVIRWEGSERASTTAIALLRLRLPQIRTARLAELSAPEGIVEIYDFPGAAPTEPLEPA